MDNEIKRQHYHFTDEELQAAKETRAEIIKNGTPELKAIYMAGEICMWDEIRYDFSQSCKCEDSPGSTWCCNLCGLPITKQNKS